MAENKRDYYEVLGVQKAFYAVSEKLYQQANPQGGAAGCDPNCGGDNVVDADYETVD